MKQKNLKRFAQARLDELKRACPVYDWKKSDNLVDINAVYPEHEWAIESPAVDLNKRQDWIHLYACDPSTKNYLEVFFERLEPGVAVVWVKLHVDDRLLLLRECLLRDNSGGSSYSAGGIRLECTAPMRLWRVAINAMMEDTSVGAELREVHVRLGGRVSVLGHTFELPKECPASFLTKKFSEGNEELQAKGEISRCCHGLQALLQPYTLFAEISLDGVRQEVVLFGSRLKFLGESKLLSDLRHDVFYADNGTMVAALEVPGKKIYGYCFDPTFFTQPIRKGRLTLSKPSAAHRGTVKSLTMKFGDESRKFDLVLSSPVRISRLGASKADSWLVEEIHGTHLRRGDLHKVQGTSFILRGSYKLPATKLVLCRLLDCSGDAESLESMILRTSDPVSKNPKMTGGKGSSLAALTSIANHLKSFTVPAAVILTVKAYELFTRDPKVRRIIESFVRGVEAASFAQLKEASESCVREIVAISLSLRLAEKLTDMLARTFGNGWEATSFAVRSSAVGEDSEEMSAAGQMTTFLGVRGKTQIFEAVVRCWASQFALTAVNYKRQYGQELDGPMAVVVQEMVKAETAGVMFTCDPVTSNPSDIRITANFGLGESVVSAAVDPDTYSFKRRNGSAVELIAKTCGSKKSMIVESECSSGTEETLVASESAHLFCLTDDSATALAEIGVSLSKITDSPRDIEWAIKGRTVYLLQSRPVTSFLRESDYEIRHDINSGFFTNREILTRANVDEVMPGALSPLSISVVFHLLFGTYCRTSFEETGLLEADRSQYPTFQTFCVGKKNYTDMSKSVFSNNKGFLESASVMMFGYDISDDDALKNGIMHDSGASTSIKSWKYMYDAARNVKKIVDAAQKYAEEMEVDLPDDGDSLSLFCHVIKQVPKLQKSFIPLVLCSLPSGLYSILALNLLKKSQGVEKNTPDIMALLSNLLKSDYEVESALIPRELTQLADVISGDPETAGFPDMDVDAALELLETSEGSAGKQFRALRKKHAHRCYKEFDLLSKTWDIDPMQLVRTLQTSAGSLQREPGAQKSLTLDQLPKQPGYLQKKLLNFLLSKAQYQVYAREASKSAMMKCFHKFRLALRRVAEQLHVEGRMVDPELIFFLTCDEIFRLIRDRDPVLMTRAMRRQKMHPQLDKERFPVLFYGMPKPLEPEGVVIDENSQCLRGTPVSQGTVTGRARVVQDFLTEAHLIRRGEILVTRATDTGWTPYFPILGGVVTEVGGLLSHGAVVAREYGLPAVVGIPGATDIIKSGDIITLDGNSGLLTKTWGETDGRVPEMKIA